MNISQIEENLQKLKDCFSKETFIYDLLLAYGLPKTSITRLKNGARNLSKEEGEISWKKKVLFKEVFDQDLHIAISLLVDNVKHDERFVIVTDYNTLLAVDTKTQDKLDIELKDFPKHYDFFLPWAGMEKTQHQNENPADVKAAEKMAKLFDEIKKDNPDESPEFIHGLNVFLCRLLFCYFAEDTNIFEEGQFTNAVASHTQTDGNDLDTYLDKLFEVLNTPEKDRKDLPVYLNAFPYVNGGLFKKRLHIPKFTRRSRQAIIDSGDLDWSVINPDIFGSMMQAVMSPEQRGGFGMHYTSVPNIMKVIEPLFLNDLREAFEKAKGNQKKRNELLKRLQSIKVFDPACGSGNFLIIAYKELRKLEMKIFKEQRSSLPISGISLGQFYGIELDDFAHEITQLSLWLAEHQMNVEFFKEFGCTNPTLPLKEAGHIVQGNACRIDWESICPQREGDEIYILGNPPYLGSRRQNDEHKKDLKTVFGNEYKSQDYISAWFYKGANFIRGQNSKLAFVTTNSITQGEQVAILWPKILNDGIEIAFAYKDFKWSNSAKSNAAVIVVIIGLQNKNNSTKTIYTQGLSLQANSISPYLVSGKEIYIESRQNNLSSFPTMNFGNMPADGGKLLFTASEKDSFIEREPQSEKWFKRLISAREFLNGQERWCLWLEDCTVDEINSMPNVKKLVKELRDIRLASSRPHLSEIPHLFAQITQPKNQNF
ncbi:MAG: N-6 DNA methylase, partial [Candidatus Thermoplasmatota archaeon]|nr:N-6 DNA methylase [Candidatus Thermoplasmatota archaeon]